METIILEQAGAPQTAAAVLINGHATQLKLPGEAARDGPQVVFSDLIETLHDTNELVRLARALVD